MGLPPAPPPRPVLPLFFLKKDGGNVTDVEDDESVDVVDEEDGCLSLFIVFFSPSFVLPSLLSAFLPRGDLSALFLLGVCLNLR